MEVLNNPPEKTQEAGNPKSKPTVTILLPAYNEAEIITRSLTILYDYITPLKKKYNWEYPHCK